MGKYLNVTTAVTVVAVLYGMAVITALVPALAPGAVAAKLIPAKTA